MVDPVIVQYAAAVIVGAIIGEALVWKLLGKPRAWILGLDIIILAIIGGAFSGPLTTLFSGTQNVFYAANFVVGLLIIIYVRSVETLAGLKVSPGGESDLARLTARELLRHGVDPASVKAALSRAGFSPGVVDDVSYEMDRSLPPYIPRLARMADVIEDMQKDVRDLQSVVAAVSGKAKGAKLAKIVSKLKRQNAAKLVKDIKIRAEPGLPAFILEEAEKAAKRAAEQLARRNVDVRAVYAKPMSATKKRKGKKAKGRAASRAAKLLSARARRAKARKKRAASRAAKVLAARRRKGSAQVRALKGRKAARRPRTVRRVTKVEETVIG